MIPAGAQFSSGAQTTRDLRRRSRATLLSLIYLKGVDSRPELARRTGMSSATVSNVVSGLIADGLVAEAGSVDSNGGRPRAVLVARPEFDNDGVRPFGQTGTEARIAELLRRAASGTDKAATAALDEAAEYMGIGVANLINMINPDRVILAGWVGEQAGATLLPGIRDAAKRHALPYLYDQTQIRMGELGPGAVAFGAATLPVARLLAAGGLAAV